MGTQLIFVLETDRRCQSDWMYINVLIHEQYDYNHSYIKLSPIFLGGRGNYNKKKVERDIDKRKSDYDNQNSSNQSITIYCFDTDNFDSNPDDKKFLDDVKQYCENKKAELVWFCKDIEEVFTGSSIENSKKKDTARLFVKRKLIKNVLPDSFTASSFKRKTSNILRVLDKFLPRKSSIKGKG